MSDHNHDLNEGDDLTDTVRNDSLTVVDVHEDGGVTLTDAIDEERYSEKEICASLRDGLLLRDGKGPELVESY
jgi:hypothetical protein